MSIFHPSGVRLPTVGEVRPRADGRRERSVIQIVGSVHYPDGTIAWQDDEWLPNRMSFAGQAAYNAALLSSGTVPPRVLALLNQGTSFGGAAIGSAATDIPQTLGTMTTTNVTEAQTPGSAGYARISEANGTDDNLGAVNDRVSLPAAVFGPFTTGTTVSHVANCTTVTGAGILVSSVPASQVFLVPVNQTYQAIFRQTAA